MQHDRTKLLLGITCADANQLSKGLPNLLRKPHRTKTLTTRNQTLARCHPLIPKKIEPYNSGLDHYHEALPAELRVPFHKSVTVNAKTDTTIAELLSVLG